MDHIGFCQHLDEHSKIRDRYYIKFKVGALFVYAMYELQQENLQLKKIAYK